MNEGNKKMEGKNCNKRKNWEEGMGGKNFDPHIRLGVK